MADRLMRAANPALTPNLDETQAIAISRKIWGHDNHRALGTGENEWYTPSKYIEAARKVLREILTSILPIRKITAPQDLPV
jgi:hypothetical protein